MIRAILFFSAIALAQASDTPDFSRYPQTDAFRFFLQTQTNATQLTHSNLLAITAFVCGVGDRAALNYSVGQDGQEVDCRFVYRWAIQNYHSIQLPAESMTRLRSAISQLPAHNESPPLDRLMIVSFRDGTNWITKTYDWQAPPEAMRRIDAIIGANF